MRNVGSQQHLFRLRVYLTKCVVQATRGGHVQLATITAPEMDYSHEEKGDALHAMEFALAMERLNLQACQYVLPCVVFITLTACLNVSG
jgi:hypothetical protein